MYIDLSLDKPMEQFSMEYQKGSKLRFYKLFFVIGPKNMYHPLNQSDVKLTTNVT